MANSITYILADDEELYRDATSQHLEDIPELTCLAVCKDAFETREKVLDLQPDLLILDIEMPGLTGVQLAKSLKKLPFIIFITSHAKYAVDAFELDAVDYLVKPVMPERLLRAIDKVKTLAGMQLSSAGNALEARDDEWFFIKENNVFIKMRYEDVLYIESLGNFSSFHLKGGSKRMALASLSMVENELKAKKFIRISRSFIVNERHITSIGTELVYLQQIQLPVGKAYADKVITAIVGNRTIKRTAR